MSDTTLRFTEEEFKSIKAKVDLVMSMCGKDVNTRLTVLSYAIVFAAIESEVTFASVVRNLAEMYDARYQEDEEDEG